MSDGVYKALCYPKLRKTTPLDTLVRLAQADGKQIAKGASVRVLDRLWSDVCGWVVIVGVNMPMVENASVVEEGKTKG